MKRLLILASVVLLAGCGLIEALGDKSIHYSYRLLNASDHVVYLQDGGHDVGENIFPSQLTLQPGEDFFWESPPLSLGMTKPLPFYASVTFDDTYTINLSISWGSALFRQYEVEDRGKKQRPLATYTFTNADYEYAVENGTTVE